MPQSIATNPLALPAHSSEQTSFAFMASTKGANLPHLRSFNSLPEPKSRLIDHEQKTHRVIIYCAGSRGLESFLRPLELYAFKIGVTGAETAQARVEDLRRMSYAGLWGRADADPTSFVDLPMAAEWAMWSWKPEHLHGLDLPRGFHLHRGALEIEFPFSASVQDVDNAVHAALRPRSLIGYLSSAQGKARLEKAGLDPECRLWSRYTLMEVTDRISAVEEIYRIKPRVEFPRLVQILEKALAPLRSHHWDGSSRSAGGQANGG
jgi:hypothetical protein